MEHTIEAINMTTSLFGWIVFAVFVVGYFFVAAEEKYHINKSKPALFIGTFMFVLIGIYYAINGYNVEPLHHEMGKLILEIAEIFFFLFVAMTFIENSLNEVGLLTKFRFLTAQEMVKQALNRKNSLGAHYRSDENLV